MIMYAWFCIHGHVCMDIHFCMYLCMHTMHIATDDNVRWMVYNGSDPFTYDRAVQFCQTHGLQLCSRRQYCEGGQDGVVLAGAGLMEYYRRWRSTGLQAVLDTF